MTGTSADGTTFTHDEVFTVVAGDVLGTVGWVPPPPLAGLVQYVPAQHRASILITTAGATVAIAAVASGLAGGFTIGGTGGMGRMGGSAGGLGGGGRGGGQLEDVELEREEDESESEEKGDRSGPWRLPGTKYLDRISKLWPSRAARISPVVGRVIIDGDYLRAMFGSIWFSFCGAAIGLGIYASASTGWYAIPPSLGIFLAILGLSVLDSSLGFLAGLSFFSCALLSGHMTSATELRLSCGIVLVWFAVPLAAAALRPLRRKMVFTVDRIWERGTDLVVCGLFGMWVAEKMTAALSDLAGVELPIDKHVHIIVFAVLIFITVRIIIETFTAHFYPLRLKVVQHEGELDSSRVQLTISLFAQIAMFIFFAISILGSSWALYVGTAVFFTPIALGIIEDRIPKSAYVSKFKPNGIVTWTLIIVTGVVLGAVLDHLIHGNQRVEEVGFIVLPLPVLTFWTLELFEEEEEEEQLDQEIENGLGDRIISSSIHETPLGGNVLQIELDHLEDKSDNGSITEDDVQEGVGISTRRKWMMRVGGAALVAISVFMVIKH